MAITQLSDLDLTGTYTYSDYLTWQFSDRVELILGKILRMSPSPNTSHQKISRQLSLYIFQYFNKGLCQAFAAPFDVRLPNKKKEIYTVVQPDLCVICDPDKLDEQGCIGAPDWILEILSPGNSKKEMRHKFQVYEEAGVREYWVVDPDRKDVLPYELDKSGTFIGKAPLTEDDREAAPSIFPELLINLQDVFNQ